MGTCASPTDLFLLYFRPWPTLDSVRSRASGLPTSRDCCQSYYLPVTTTSRAYMLRAQQTNCSLAGRQRQRYAIHQQSGIPLMYPHLVALKITWSAPKLSPPLGPFADLPAWRLRVAIWALRGPASSCPGPHCRPDTKSPAFSLPHTWCGLATKLRPYSYSAPYELGNLSTTRV